MEKKIFLQELCLELEEQLNYRSNLDKHHTVEFFSGLKPDNYLLPMIHIGTTQSMLSELKLIWFVEISIDGTVIFREYSVPEENEDLKIIEEFVIDKTIHNVFNRGIISSKNFMDERL